VIVPAAIEIRFIGALGPGCNGALLGPAGAEPTAAAPVLAGVFAEELADPASDVFVPERLAVPRFSELSLDRLQPIVQASIKHVGTINARIAK